MLAMRIESFWTRGYRSLRDVLIEGLGPFNVFYGPNGGGKSNILEAIVTLIGLARVAATTEELPTSPKREAADAVSVWLLDNTEDGSLGIHVLAQQLVDRMVVSR